MRIYVAGPMANQPDHGFPAFRVASAQLRAQDHEVFCPTEGVSDETLKMAIAMGNAFKETVAYARLMERDIREGVLWSEAVFVLPGWEKSSGATLEVNVAKITGRSIHEFQEDTAVYPCLHEGCLLAVVGPSDDPGSVPNVTPWPKPADMKVRRG